MMSDYEMKNMTMAAWMEHSHKPPMHEWLAPDQSEIDKSRMGMLGNLVVPQMAWFAANMLARMWT